MKLEYLEKILEKLYKIRFLLLSLSLLLLNMLKKAAQQFGGEAIVYTVKPDYYSLIKKGTEYICDRAFIKTFEKIQTSL